MASDARWVRVFVALLLAVGPPLLLVAGAAALTTALFGDANPAIVALVVGIGTLVWTLWLSLALTPSLLGRAAAEPLAGEGTADRSEMIGAAPRSVAASLSERERQVAALAAGIGAVSIEAPPREVVRDVTRLTRDVTGDPTWRAAVLTSQTVELEPGVYDVEAHTLDPVTDLEMSLAVSGEDPVRHMHGPWGAFVLVDVTTDGAAGFLYAPWEGRNEPSPADQALLALIGRHARTAIDHSMLFTRVRRQAEELDAMHRLQSDFLRSVSHDLQTPLTRIAAIASELRAHARSSESDAAADDLAVISQEAERLRRMVSQLLVASRIEAGHLVVQQDVFSAEPVIRRVWRAIAPTRELELSLAGDPCLVVGDEDRLEQVLWALLDNALKYGRADTPVRVTVEGRQGRVAISVRDEGIGMDATTRARAYDQFYRSDDARRLVPDGSGVGLYAAQGLVTLMGGSIELHSQVGSGTTVTVSLPGEPVGSAEE